MCEDDAGKDDVEAFGLEKHVKESAADPAHVRRRGLGFLKAPVDGVTWSA
jgi:hypothetical protein